MDSPEFNPYAAPLAAPISEAFHQNNEVMSPAAGLGKRFLNLLLDRVVVVCVTYVLGFCIGMLEKFGVVHGVVDALVNAGFWENLLLDYFITVSYYALLEGLFGRTVGKWITGTKVISATGSPLTFGSAVLRSICRLVPFDALSFLGSESSGWHDKWSKTQVVDLRAKPVPKPRPMSEGNMPRFYTPQVPVRANIPSQPNGL